MKCPYLIKWLTFACKANDKIYFPSYFQLQEYCKCEGYKKCPFHLKIHDEYLEEGYLQVL